MPSAPNEISPSRSWLLIPVFFIGLVVLGGLTGLLSRQIRTTQRAIVRETSKMYGIVTESLRNIELVKSLGLAGQEYRRLEGYTRRFTSLRFNRVRRQIGFVTQDPQLFSGTVRENLQFVKADATDEEMMAALEAAADCAPPEHDCLCRPHLRAGEGAHRRDGHARRAVGKARPLLRHVAPADRRAATGSSCGGNGRRCAAGGASVKLSGAILGSKNLNQALIRH